VKVGIDFYTPSELWLPKKNERIFVVLKYSNDCLFADGGKYVENGTDGTNQGLVLPEVRDYFRTEDIVAWIPQQDFAKVVAGELWKIGKIDFETLSNTRDGDKCT